MTVQKNDCIYTVTESTLKWKVSKTIGKLSLAVDVPKEICKTFESLQEYVISNRLF